MSKSDTFDRNVLNRLRLRPFEMKDMLEHRDFDQCGMDVRARLWVVVKDTLAAV
jgi:hypothetical protein